jgi:hypothetical protein
MNLSICKTCEGVGRLHLASREMGDADRPFKSREAERKIARYTKALQ